MCSIVSLVFLHHHLISLPIKYPLLQGDSAIFAPQLYFRAPLYIRSSWAALL